MNHDSANQYFNFMHPHRASTPGMFAHRLGAFQACGGGQRKGQPEPRIGILHVPVFDVPTLSGDFTAERVAAYLADPPENQNPAKYGLRFASVHACSDRDSYVLCLPADSICWGCGNFNTAAESWEIEIAGLGTEPGSYWSGPEGTAKLRQAARAHVKAAQLAFGEDWRRGIVPPQKGALDAIGKVTRPGWLQHRDVPFWSGSSYAQPPEDNIRAGQHSDICADFPYERWFSILANEINAGAQP
jgi:hypothetical protein